MWNIIKFRYLLVNLAKLMAPYTPFLSEELYQNLVVSADNNAETSVHLADFPGVLSRFNARGGGTFPARSADGGDRPLGPAVDELVDIFIA